MVYEKQVDHAECAVLGSVLLFPERLEEISSIISTPDCFHSEANKAIWLALSDLNERGIPIDLLTISNALEASKSLDTVGGRVYLTNLTGMIPNSANAAYYAWILENANREQYIRRILQSGIEEIGKKEIDDLCGKLVQQIEDTSASRGDVRDIGRVMREGRSGEIGGGRTISTGYDKLDDYLGGGFKEKHFIVIAACTSVGKSEFLANLCLKMRIDGKPARMLLVSLEMSGEEFEDRLTGNYASIPKRAAEAMREEIAQDYTWESYGENYQHACCYVRNLPLLICDDGDLTAEKFRSLVAQHKKQIDIVAIDYLQLVSSTDKRAREYDIITGMSKACKSVAMRYRKPVIALSQFSRNVDKEQRRPRRSDLRGTGQIENDANVILLLWRPQETGATEETMEVNLAKQRGGPTGLLKFDYNLKTGRIEEKSEMGD